IKAALPASARRVVLDERGRDIDTATLAHRFEAWREGARPVAILVGGPDGLEPALKASADETLRLSSLTLPHPLVRVLLAEQLYRAWSINAGHPYHRACSISPPPAPDDRNCSSASACASSCSRRMPRRPRRPRRCDRSTPAGAGATTSCGP